MKLKTNRILYGLCLIAFGVLLLLNAFGKDVNIFFPGWWTLLIIVPCVAQLFTQHDKEGALYGIATGISLYLPAAGIISWGKFWLVFLGTVIIVTGICKLLYGGSVIEINWSKKYKQTNSDNDDDDN